MSENHKVEQRDVTAGGDVAGGNIDKSITVNTLKSHRSPLSGLIARYASEVRSEQTGSEIIAKLEHWSTTDGHEVLGVREKLERGNRHDLVRFALHAKELFAKCLVRHQHSLIAQEMFAYLLGSIWQKFNATISPRIAEGRTHEEIDILIQTNIIEPMVEILDSNPLNLDPSELSGMMYFLTGNCHLNWE